MQSRIHHEIQKATATKRFGIMALIVGGATMFFAFNAFIAGYDVAAWFWLLWGPVIGFVGMICMEVGGTRATAFAYECAAERAMIESLGY